jgi:CheY-like chemotaxis protein
MDTANLQHPYILMVEHDADDQALTIDVFKENNYGVPIVFKQSGGAAWDFLEEVSTVKTLPSLILLNVMMAPVDGIEILKAIKAHAIFKSIPVVMLADSDLPFVVNRCYEAGANSFVKKPSSSQGTSEAIDNFIRYWFVTNCLPSVNALNPSESSLG